MRCVSSRFLTDPPRRFEASINSLASFSRIVLPSPRDLAYVVSQRMLNESRRFWLTSIGTW